MKNMDQLTNEDQARLYPIILKEYNSEWLNWFNNEKVILENLIGFENIISIQHFGSTSVVGLLSKPTIDILLEIHPQTNIEKMKECLKSNYICLEKQTIPTNDILLFLKGYTPTGFAEKVFHIHVRYQGDWDEIYFKNYLIANPKIANEYAKLKIKLKDKYEFNRDEYTKAKGDFITKITKIARHSQ